MSVHFVSTTHPPAMEGLSPWAMSVLLNAVALQARALTRARCARISAAPVPGGSAHAVSLGKCDDLPEIVDSLASGGLESVVREGRTLRAHRLSLAPTLAQSAPRVPELASVLAVPIAGTRAPRGYLCLAFKHDSDGFSDPDERLACILAARVSVALASALNHEREGTPGENSGGWLQTTVDQWREGIVAVDLAGIVTLENLAARGFDGSLLIREGSHASTAPRICYPSGEPIAVGESPLERAVHRRETTIGMECLATGLPQGETPLLHSAAPLYVDERQVGAIAVFQEVGSLEERSCEGRVLVLGHDLRQPLNVITLAIGMAQRSAKNSDGPQHQRALERIANAAERLNRMIDDLVER